MFIFPVSQLQQRSQQIMWILCPGHTNLSGSYSCLFPRRSRDVHILDAIFRDYLSITIILRSVVLDLVTLVLSIVSVPRSRILDSEGHHHTQVMRLLPPFPIKNIINQPDVVMWPFPLIAGHR